MMGDNVFHSEFSLTLPLLIGCDPTSYFIEKPNLVSRKKSKAFDQACHIKWGKLVNKGIKRQQIKTTPFSIPQTGNYLKIFIITIAKDRIVTEAKLVLLAS